MAIDWSKPLVDYKGRSVEYIRALGGGVNLYRHVCIVTAANRDQFVICVDDEGGPFGVKNVPPPPPKAFYVRLYVGAGNSTALSDSFNTLEEAKTVCSLATAILKITPHPTNPIVEVLPL